ncbi:MarR family transcriptional regulator [Tsukamurella sp. 8F]|uniref:MarR family winged helix-turn-helix transcriptional regulator n=1 Tax=unclassified Tsukamurella TaxID=2633480 RepID=UPI0023B96169|nr:MULTISPECIES: MarR family transcriptional regulator [unclassified Tsukamurella]MDF0531902.1 MarR family transcriptional regulator [Tsukamurella sp. 8J]MDF0586958.1 MarR family transcriptional regulator [Tsukamurella sp. 8F]
MVDPHREIELREAIEGLFFGYRAFTALPDRMLAERGLGRTHHRILYFVRREPGIAMGDLLAILQVSKQAAHRPLKELVEQELVVVTPDPDDRRARRLTATHAGEALEGSLSEAQMELLDATFGRVGPAAEKAFCAVMRELGRHTGEV